MALRALSIDAWTWAESYRALLALAEGGELRPVIDSVLPFDQIVDAHRRVDTGHKVGSLVLTFDREA